MTGICYGLLVAVFGLAALAGVLTGHPDLVRGGVE